MQLDTYLTQTGTTEHAFAALIGVKQSAVNKYRHGDRMPKPAILQKITEVTDGKVTANDFVAKVAGR